MKVDELQRWKLQEGPWFTKMAKAEDGNLIFYSDAKAEIRKMDNLIVEQGAQLDQIDSLLNGEDVCDFALSYPVIRKVSDLIFTSKAIEEENDRLKAELEHEKIISTGCSLRVQQIEAELAGKKSVDSN